jgi:alpha/beta superfamily hydrolase
VPLDEALLHHHRRYESPETGISEEFLQPILGSGRTVAVLSRPIGDAHRVGWVISHSFAMEQIHLSRLDTQLARALSASGFPVLRFHGQGYGDSIGGMEGISMTSHLADASDAVDLMMEQDGVETVGVMGSRFGGTIAALTADRKRLPFMAAWEPIINGKLYVRDFFRSRVFSEIVLQAGKGSSTDVDQLRRELESTGRVDVKGFELTRTAHDEISALDLVRDMQNFAGSGLLVGISRSGTPSSAVTKLAGRLEQLGADISLDGIAEPNAAQFGQFHFRAVDGGRGKIDTQIELTAAICSMASRWTRMKVGAPVATVKPAS